MLSEGQQLTRGLNENAKKAAQEEQGLKIDQPVVVSTLG